jgi:hypothetical protein
MLIRSLFTTAPLGRFLTHELRRLPRMTLTRLLAKMMRLAMLVAVRSKRLALMQLVAVMQNLLMIALTLASMNTTMRLDPRIVLMCPRSFMRMPAMIGRLSHVLVRPTLRHHRSLTTTTTLKIHLTRMMKPSLILSHRLCSYPLAVGVYVYECANPFLSNTVPEACVFCNITATRQITSAHC